MGFFAKWTRSSQEGRGVQRTGRLRLEELETRLTPAWSGNAWPHPDLITISFMPDGTLIGAGTGGMIYSNLFAKFNAHPGWTTATWQNKIIAAAQTWAQQTNINFDIVSDNGASVGGGTYQQGDPEMGDIRVGGYTFLNNWLASAYQPPPVNNFSIAGDVNFNTAKGYNIGTAYDLFTVAVHEFGHALGLSHSTVPLAAMWPSYNVIKNSLNADDITSVRAAYGGARAADAYDAAASNGSFATATDLTAQIDPASLTALQTGLDITTTSDVDFYTFTAPTDTSGTLTVQVQTDGLSLLRQAVTVYAADRSTVLGTASSAGAYDGTTVSITVNGVTPGQVFYVKVAGADATAFGTGRYAMTLNLGSGASPAVPLPDTQTAMGDPIQGGGGEYQAGRWWDNEGYEVLGFNKPQKNKQHLDGPVTGKPGQGLDLALAVQLATTLQESPSLYAGLSGADAAPSLLDQGGLPSASLGGEPGQAVTSGADQVSTSADSAPDDESLSDAVFQQDALFTLLSSGQ